MLDLLSGSKVMALKTIQALSKQSSGLDPHESPETTFSWMIQPEIVERAKKFKLFYSASIYTIDRYAILLKANRAGLLITDPQ